MEMAANEYLGYAEEQHSVDKLVNMTCKHCRRRRQGHLRDLGRIRSVAFAAEEDELGCLGLFSYTFGMSGARCQLL